MNLRCLFVIWACAAVGTTAEAVALADLPKDAIQVDGARLSSARRSAFTRDEWQKLSAQSSAQELVDRIAALCQSANPLLAETSLSLWLDEVAANKRVQLRDQSALSALTRCESRVFVVHEESAGQWWLPAFPLAARATALLKAEALHAEADHLAHEWTHSRFDTARLAVDARTAQFAVERLELAATAKLALQAEQLPAAALVPLAVRQYSQTLFAQIRARAAAEQIVAELPNLVSMVPLPERLAWLQALAARPELASVSIATAGSLDSAPMREWLMALLDQPGLGASAAQALANKVSAEQWSAIAMDTRQTRPKRLHAVLALRLRGDSEPLLKQLASDADLPPDIAADLLP